MQEQSHTRRHPVQVPAVSNPYQFLGELNFVLIGTIATVALCNDRTHHPNDGRGKNKRKVQLKLIGHMFVEVVNPGGTQADQDWKKG